MKKEEIIDEIIKSQPLHLSTKLLSWIQQSEENRKEFIRYKNIRALFQRGKEMDEKAVAEDFRLLKDRIKRDRNRFKLRELIKYAAIIVFALISGYLINSINTDRKVAVNEISVPNGSRSLIVLPDGSKVWLTNGSKLVYPETFTGKTRDVKLEGEAFFTVARNEKKHFIVNLGEQKIKVLGTEFSVIAYPDDNTVRVDLISGKVLFDIADYNDANGKYKPYILEPLNSLVLDKTSGSIMTSSIQDSFYKYWQEGIYQFKDEPLASLAKKIERIYNVKIISEDSIINHIKFTGAFHVETNIYTIIEAFKRASMIPIEYTIDENRINLKCLK